MHTYSRGAHPPIDSWACRLALGRLLAEGGVPFQGTAEHVDGGAPSALRSAPAALPHLQRAAAAGEWGSLGHTAFQYYLAGDFDSAGALYARSALLGSVDALENEAYLVQRRLVQVRPTHARQLAVRLYARAFAGEASGTRSSAALPLAEALLEEVGAGRGGVEAVHTALALLTHASAQGSAAAAFTLGSVYATGVSGAAQGAGRQVLLLRDEARAGAFFERAKALAPTLPARVPVYLAVAGLQVEAWLRRFAWMRGGEEGEGAAAPSTAPHSGWLGWAARTFASFFEDRNAGFEASVREGHLVQRSSSGREVGEGEGEGGALDWEDEL